MAAFWEMLTPDEEQLVVDNMGLVHWTCRRVSNRHEYEDRVQDGMLGLMRAVQGFDPSRGFAFSTYAVPWIRQAIGRGRDAELGSARRAALRAGEEWRPPVALEGAKSAEGLALADMLASSDDDPADVVERSIAIAPVLAACRDELDRAVVVAVATGAPLREVGRERHVTVTTIYDRLDRITAIVTGASAPLRTKAAVKAECIDCGGPCSKTRCRPCFDLFVEAELARAEAS